MRNRDNPISVLPTRIFSNPEVLADDLNALLTSLPQAVVIGDHQGIVRANGIALRMLDADGFPDGGLSFDQLTARSRLVHTRAGQSLTRGEHPFAQALLGRFTFCDAALNDPASGRQQCLRCTGAPIRRGGVQIGALAIYHDISDLKRTTEVLTRTNEELHEFSAFVAHDLREPLRMIRSFLELAAMRTSIMEDSEALRFLNFATDSAKRMQKLIEDLLELTRVGQQHLIRSRIDCSGAVYDALGMLAGTLRERHAEVRVGPMPEVYADRSHLMRLFQNLIGNSVKYCRDGVPPSIQIDAERREHDTLFSIRDNGIGISPEDSQRIFAPFDRVGEKKDAPGSGLGLAICRRIISRHRGDIWVESAPQGCIFKFTIPHQTEEGALEARTRSSGT